MRRAVVASLVLVVLQFAVGFYLYPGMPESMAIHWGLSGEADGYGSRFMGLFLIPLVTAVMIPFLVALPRLDPSGGMEGFRSGYDLFVFGFVAFLSYVYGLSLAWNLGWRFSFMRVLAPAIGALFVGIGVVMGEARRNWFFGVRTPWTMSSDEVWDRTHKAGSRLFMASGALTALGAFTEGWLALALILGPVLFTGIYLTYYSYSEYHKLDTRSVD